MLIPFDLEKALNGAKIVTRAGEEITEWHYFKTAQEPYSVHFVYDGEIEYATVNGFIYTDTEKSSMDLMVSIDDLPEPNEKKFYMNIWNIAENSLIGSILCTQEQCKKIRDEEIYLPKEHQRKFVKTVEIILDSGSEQI